MTWRILIPDRLKGDPDIERSVFGDDAVFLMPGVSTELDVPDEYWATADAILAWHEVNLHAGIIARLERCRVIVRVGAGYDNVDLTTAAARGIPVCNVPDYGTNDVADHAMALMLAFARGLPAYDASAREGQWSWEAAGVLRRLAGATLGIIGLGRIGTATALRAKAFGMRVVFHDPYKEAGYDKALGITRVEKLEALLDEAEVVSLHTPLTEETRGLANAAFFAKWKPGGTLINVARGRCLDLDALHRALESGRVRAAGLDVLPDEPPDPQHPLIEAWRAQAPWLRGRLIITPHAASYNRESHEEMRRKAAEEALRVLRGDPPRYCVSGRSLTLLQNR